MATANYSFPEVESTDRIAASAINDLATPVLGEYKLGVITLLTGSALM